MGFHTFLKILLIIIIGGVVCVFLFGWIKYTSSQKRRNYDDYHQ